MTMHRDRFLVNETNRCTVNFPVFLVVIIALHVSGSLSVHHQELLSRTTALVQFMQLGDRLLSGSRWNCVLLIWKIRLCCLIKNYALRLIVILLNNLSYYIFVPHNPLITIMCKHLGYVGAVFPIKLQERKFWLWFSVLLSCNPGHYRFRDLYLKTETISTQSLPFNFLYIDLRLNT